MKNECCQGTTSPTGKLCGNCPHTPPKVYVSATDPTEIAARMKAAGTFDKDQPWPGWNAGKKLVVKEPEVAAEPEEDRAPEYIDPHAAWLATIDFSEVEKRVIAMLGIDVNTWDRYTDTERGTAIHKALGGMFASGGHVQAGKTNALFGMSGPDAVFQSKGRLHRDPANVHVVNIDVKGADLDALQKKIVDAMALPPRFLTPTGRMRWPDLQPSRVFEDKDFFLNIYDESTVLKESPPCQSHAPRKRYATYEETRNVRAGPVLYQTPKGTIFREERRSWNDRDEARYMDLSTEAHKFKWQDADKWTAGEARVYSMYRTAKAQRERGWMVKSKKIVGREGKRTDVIDIPNVWAHARELGNIPCRVYNVPGLKPKADLLMKHFGHAALEDTVEFVLRSTFGFQKMPSFDSMSCNTEHTHITATWTDTVDFADESVTYTNSIDIPMTGDAVLKRNPIR